MNLFGRPEIPSAAAPHEGVPILVRLWKEDDVWNASAFDIGVSVFGDTFEEAKQHFEEALEAHFDLLIEMGRAQRVVAELRDKAAERGFYEERIQPRDTVVNFEVPYHGMALCAAGAM